MIRCCVIADDLTGANATGVLLRKVGLRTCTLLQPDRLTDEQRSRFDAVSVPTDSRGVHRDEAYRRVSEAAGRFVSPEVVLYNKRIDSTLRGNIGSEIDAMLDSFDEPRLAVVVPVFPKAGRIAVGGYLLVNGVLLQQTDAARDPKMPVRTSVIRRIVEHQTRFPVRTVDLDTVYTGANAVAGALRTIGDGERSLVIFDAITDADLDTIAAGMIESGLRTVTADPGPYTAAVARRIAVFRRERSPGARVLMCVGSVTSATVEQLQHAFENLDVSWEFLRAEEAIGEPEQAEREISRVCERLSRKAGDSEVLCISSNRLDLSRTLNLAKEAERRGVDAEELSNRINRAIAAAAERMLDSVPTIGGVFASGGDITVALCESSSAEGVALQKEVIPLAARGALVGGRRAGLRIISKGGIVGGTDAATLCVRSLLEDIERQETSSGTGES